METNEIKKEEVVEEPKRFEDMTDEEKLMLPAEELAKNLESSETETPAEKESGEKEEEEKSDATEEEKDEETEEEKDEFEKSVEFAKYSPKEKGLYYDLKKERKQRQEYEQSNRDYELEIAKEKARNEVQQKYLTSKKESKSEYVNEYDRVIADIEKKAVDWEKETGEEYRLTLRDQRAIDNARKTDSLVGEQRLAVNNLQSRISADEDAYKSKLKAEGVEDYDLVYEKFIAPKINPDINPDKAEAVFLSSMLIKSKKPASYAYEHIAKLSAEGREYFKSRETKKHTEKILKTDKKIPKTSAHLTSTKASLAREKVPGIEEVNNNFDYWHKKLTEEQMIAVCNGENVYI